MTLKTYVDGEILYGPDLNDSLDYASSIHRNTSSEDTTEYSVVTTSNWADVGYSKTFTCPENKNIIRGLRLQFDAKTSNTGQITYYRAVLTNNTNGNTITFTNGTFSRSQDGYNAYASVLGAGASTTSYVSQDQYAHAIGITMNVYDYNAYGTRFAASTNNFKAIQDGATYTLRITAWNGDYAQTPTAYIKNITATIYWDKLADDEVSGWA